jgi:outer membrane protein OmpA-like peptidoglycan-associated protein
MKKYLSFVLFVLLLFSQTVLKAQVPVSSTIIDDEVRQLAQVVYGIEQINALLIEFKPSASEIDPGSEPNLRKQAEILKKFPAGTVVEIGAHSWGYYDKSSGKVVAGVPTAERAEAVRRKLIQFGVNPASLIAKGYGITELIDTSKPNAESRKNERIEFLVEKMAGSNSAAAPNAAQKSASSANAIVAGKGWEKVVIGASQAQIENALGKPEKFYAGNMILPDPSAQYFSRGIIVVYDAQKNLVKSIDFVGNPAYLDAGSYAGTFRKTAGRPDKNLEWGTSAVRIIAAYGEPKHESVRKSGGIDEVTLTYDQIAFTLNADKLYYIVVADNSRYLAAVKKEADEKPARDKYAAELNSAAQPLAYKSEYTIIPGRGTDKVFLGATRTAVEAAVGQPDEFVDEDAGLFRIYEAHYFAKGFKVEYDPQTKLATAVLFFGDTSKTKSFGKFKLFPGTTDKTIRWGMSPADVIKAYGKPVEERTRYNPKLDKDYEFITYPNVAFGFTENRLVYIANEKIWGNK